MSNPASYAIYARVVQQPLVAGDTLVYVPGPDVAPRHPGRPDLLKITAFTKSRLFLARNYLAHGGTISVELLAPDPIAGADALASVDTGSLRISPFGMRIRNPADGSFLVRRNTGGQVTGDEIIAEVQSASGTAATWTTTAGRYSGTTAPTHYLGTTFTFLPQPPAHAYYLAGDNSCSTCAAAWWTTIDGKPADANCGHGCRSEKNPPYEYGMNAVVGSETGSLVLLQDEVDRIRQEYASHRLDAPPAALPPVGIPNRDEFRPFASSSRRFQNIQGTQYGYHDANANADVGLQLGEPGVLGDEVFDMLDAISQDIQVSAAGSTPGPFQTVVVGPTGILAGNATAAGRGAQTSRDLPPITPANNGCVARVGHGPSDPDPDCDDEPRPDGMSIGAGRNGRAETAAVRVPLMSSMRISSGWRNPERNEAVGGSQFSAHQAGDAIDLVFDRTLPTPTTTYLSNRTDDEVQCLVVTAGYRVVNGCAPTGPCVERCQPWITGLTQQCRWLAQAESGPGAYLSCDDPTQFHHVHVNR